MLEYVGGYWSDCTGEVFAPDMVSYDRGLEAYEVADVNAIIEFAKGWKEEQDTWKYHGVLVGDRDIEYTVKKRED